MYEALNKYVVVEMPETKTTASGIEVSTQSNDQTREVKVIHTNEITKDLQDKTIICPRHKLFEIGQEGNKKIAVINYEDIYTCLKNQ